MDFAAEIAKIKAQVEDEAVATALGESKSSEIRNALRGMDSAYTDMSERLSHANSESKTRKLKIRDHEAKIVELEDSVEDLTGKADTTKLNEELTTLRDYKKTTIANMRGGFEDNFKGVSEHDNFAKAENLFHLPAKGDDGKFKTDDDGNFDFSGLTDTDMEANIAKMTELNGLGLFGESEPASNNRGDGNMGQRNNSNASTKIKEAREKSDFAALEAAVPD